MDYTMSQPIINRQTRARRIVIAWLVALVALEAAFGVAMQGPLHSLRNPAFADRFALLRKQQDKCGERPVALIMGTSRSLNGIRPDLLEPTDVERSAAPMVFNFSSQAHGPTHQYVRLKRLLREGVHPSTIVLEIVPHQLGTGPGDQINPLNLDYRDLLDSLPFREAPEDVNREWLKAQWLFPCYSYRYHIVGRLLPNWYPDEQRVVTREKLDAFGWEPYYSDELRRPPSADTLRKRFQPLLHTVWLSPTNDRAIQEIIATCRAERIQLIVLFMPEGPIYRSCYTSQAEAFVKEFQDGLRSHPGVTVVDARQWMDSEQFFVDSHHLKPEAAALFTERFKANVLGLLAPSRDQLSAAGR